MNATSLPKPAQWQDLRIIISALALLGLVFFVQAIAYGPLAFGIGRVALLVALAAGFAITLQWRNGVYLVLVYVTVEGFVTNFLYPSTTPLLFKDFLIAGAYLGFVLPLLQGRKMEVAPSSVIRPVGVLMLLALIQAFNPRGVEPGVALVGARVLLYYIPLYALGFAMGREPGGLDRLVRFILITSVPITVYGLYQYNVGPDAAKALGEGFERTVWIVGPEATKEHIYRPASTFSFVGHFGAYLLFITIIGFAALHARTGGMWRVVASGIFGLTAVATVLQTQRTTWVLLPVAAVGMYLLSRNPRGIVRGAPVAMIGLLLAFMFGGSVIDNRLPALISGTGIYDHRLYQTYHPFQSNLLSVDALVGHGTGTALGAARYVTGGQVPGAFESGWYTAFYMFGIWGLLVYSWLYVAVLRAAWAGVRSIAADQRWVPAALFMYTLLIGAISGPVTFPPANIYFWLFAGVLAGCAWTGARSPTSPDANEETAERPDEPEPAQSLT